MLASIAHYDLLERVAEGGMGVVYKARDRDLDRLVALKFLPNGAAESDERFDAFLHEARAISRLNHPSIATIYGVQEVKGERFLSMEYLPGGTLRGRIAEHPTGLPYDRILAWAEPIAGALAHSHSHGIIHRDVKSENVLLTADEQAKLTDFGVALAIEAGLPAEAEVATGTVAYMSPEQAQGLQVDHRSDMFSFGVVLYEMAAGNPPFTDVREAVVLYDIVNSEPPPIHRPDLPRELVDLIMRMLQKDPADRFASMDEVVDALAALSPQGRRTRRRETPKDPAVAVMPFVDMSPERDQEYFCDGVAEEITLALSQVRGLRVISRASTFEFKNQAYDIRKIGRELNVAAVLEGSVRKAGETLRVSVQLVSVEDGSHLWSERYDRKLEDVFAIQEEIAASIVSWLKLRLAGRRSASKAPTPDLDAYNDYLAGRYALNQRTRPSIELALECFERAIGADPDFGLAHGAKAEALVLMCSRGYVEDVRKQFDVARAAAERAIELQPSRAEPYVALALVRLRADWDWAGSEESFRRAIELNDGYATAHHQYAMYLAMVMRLDKARREIRRAHELDPLSLLISTAVGRILHFSRRYEEAVEQCRRTVQMAPDFLPAQFDLLISLAMLDQAEEAYRIIQRMEELLADPVRQAVLLGRYHAIVGETEEAERQRGILSELAKKHPVSPVIFALIDIALNRIDDAVELLHEGADQRDDLLVYLQCEPAYDAIREHRRYPDLIRKVGFPPLP